MQGPIGYRLLIIPDEEEKSNIIIPDWVRDKQQAAMDSGVVIEIGLMAGNHFHGYRFSDPELDVRVGDRVIFTKYAGAVMNYPGEDERYIDDRNGNPRGKKCRCINDQDIYYNLTKRSPEEVDKLLADLEGKTKKG